LSSLPRVKRAEIGELAGRYQHAARMHADVTRKPFEAFGELEQLAHFFFLLLALIYQRLDLARIDCLVIFGIGAAAQCYMRPGWNGTSFAIWSQKL
jgi:hypothetical protein